MKNLIQRLLGRDTQVDSEQAKKFFNQLGIDMYSIGFPGFQTSESSSKNFRNVRASLVNVDNIPTMVVTGDYTLQYRAGHRESVDSVWQPTPKMHYKFKIQDGRMEIKDK